MKLSFRTVTGKIYTIEISPDKTLNDAKSIIKEQHHFDTDNCQFIFGAAILSDTKPVSELKIRPDNYIAIYNPTRPRSIRRPDKIEPIPQGVADPKPVPQYVPTDLTDSPERPTRATTTPTSDDPPNFNQLVSDLQDMGFPEEQCKQALRATRYNMQAAVDRLLNGSEGSAPPPPASPPREVFHRSSGRYGELQNLFDALSDDEKAAVSRLEQLGLDSITVLQIYLACEKDEASATSCINEMLN